MSVPYPVVPWRSFVDFVNLSASGCPVSLIERALRDAAIRYCQRTHIWHFASLPSTLRKGQPRYGFAAPEGAEVIGLKSVTVNGSPVAPCTEPEWPYGNKQSGSPRIWRMEEPETLLFWPVPDRDVADAIEVTVLLAPAYDAAMCPKMLFPHHREGIVEGARETLMLMPGTAWGNPQFAAVSRARFLEESNAARIREQRGGSPAILRIRPVPFL